MIYEHLNLEYLYSASRNKEFVFKIFAVYKQEIPRIESNMKKALSESDTATLAKVAHKAKSSCGVVGCKTLVETAAKIEQAASNSISIEELTEMCDQFIAFAKVSLVELEDAENHIKNGG